MKFFNFNLEKVNNSCISICFHVDGLKGVDTIVDSFKAGKSLLEGKIMDGVMSFINVAMTIYNFVKSGKK